MKSAALTLFIVPFFVISTWHINDRPLEDHPVVLELFTSQGCSSCPPADRLLKAVRSENVIALSYHVDYWDYIGWKDPFASEKYTNRQRRYGNKFYSSTIYTPQLVVNGREHFVGSDRQKLNQKIKQYSAKKRQNSISISNINERDGVVNFDYKLAQLTEDDYLRIILVIDERKTSVKRGENRNRELINSNIVIAEQQFKIDKSIGNGQIRIPNLVKESDQLSLVLVVENRNMDISNAVQKRI